MTTLCSTAGEPPAPGADPDAVASPVASTATATAMTSARRPAAVPSPRPARGALRDRLGRDDGMATAEYAIATVAAAGFAGLLITVLRSDEIRGLLAAIVRGALSV